MLGPESVPVVGEAHAGSPPAALKVAARGELRALITCHSQKAHQRETEGGRVQVILLLKISKNLSEQMKSRKK